jgi:glycine/D-amino acid oxidase-like deaminating enzyme/nitrite reductase/ring-hydroxylating ferredoxin subunit
VSASLWTETASLPAFAPLGEPLTVDVLVVGGGITGLTAALLLARAGEKVALIEADRIGQGETGHTTAHLTAVLDTRYHVLASKFGHAGARAAAESSRAAIDRIEAFTREFAADCGFRRLPAYLFAETKQQARELDRELRALQRVGLDAAMVDQLPLDLPARAAVRIAGQAQFHPLEYLREMTTQLLAAGAQLFEQTRLVQVEDGHPCRMTTSRGPIAARHVVVATNQPTASRFALHTKVAAYRTYAVAAPLQQAFPEGLFWDMQDPYHYTRVQRTTAGTFLIVGGEDHKTGQKTDTEACFERLTAYARRLLPGAEIAHRWSGQIVEPSDGLPYIGRNPGDQHVYVATGFSGNGMTFGTLAAMILSDEVLGIRNPWARLFRAGRAKPIAAARAYLGENLDFPAYFARDRLGSGQVASSDEIPAGEGRLWRAGGKMLAVYRDDAGGLHAHSAVCPHLGCNVRWNNAERTWDCPCHGSRFDRAGHVLNGPATRDLVAAPLPAPGSSDDRWGIAARGSVAGLAGTAAMSVALLGAQKLGLLGRMPPKRITQAALRALHVRGSKRGENLLSTVAHVGYGVGAGVLFAALAARLGRRGPAPRVAGGVGFGLAIWGLSYLGWVPALGIMPPAHRDRPGRPTAMVLGHMIYGAVLGGLSSPGQAGRAGSAEAAGDDGRPRPPVRQVLP